MAEINRVTENSGFFIFSDPRTDNIDESGFIDDFQKLIPDGHNHFYRENEIMALFARHNFKKEKLFYSTIRYPRDYNKDYETLFKKTDNKILDNYKINREKRKVFITVTVLNILFKKIKEIYKSGNIFRH